MLIVALFAIAKIWRQSKYSSVDEWIKKLRTSLCLSVCLSTYLPTDHGIIVMKKNEMMPFVTIGMDPEGIC